MNKKIIIIELIFQIKSTVIFRNNIIIITGFIYFPFHT